MGWAEITKALRTANARRADREDATLATITDHSFKIASKAGK